MWSLAVYAYSTVLCALCAPLESPDFHEVVGYTLDHVRHGAAVGRPVRVEEPKSVAQAGKSQVEFRAERQPGVGV